MLHVELNKLRASYCSSQGSSKPYRTIILSFSRLYYTAFTVGRSLKGTYAYFLPLCRLPSAPEAT